MKFTELSIIRIGKDTRAYLELKNLFFLNVFLLTSHTQSFLIFVWN